MGRRLYPWNYGDRRKLEMHETSQRKKTEEGVDFVGIRKEPSRREVQADGEAPKRDLGN